MTNLENAFRKLKNIEDKADVLRKMFEHRLYMCKDCDNDDEAFCYENHDCFDSFLKWAFDEDEDEPD